MGKNYDDFDHSGRLFYMKICVEGKSDEGHGESRPQDSTLSGFPFYKSSEGGQIRIASKSLDRIKKKMREKAKRYEPAPAKEKIKEIEAAIRGWVNYFAIAKGKKKMQELMN